MANAYRYRPVYPPEVFDILGRLAVDRPRRALDVGAGTGFVALPLTREMDTVDAVDISPEMVARGRALPGGDARNLNWIVGAAEEVALSGPYALITAGDSLHWMDWNRVMSRFADVLSPRGVLAILTVDVVPPPWRDALLPIIELYSTVKDWQPVDLVTELEERGLFQRQGERLTAPVPFAQPVDDYVESFHGRASFSRQRMTPDRARAFDAAVRAVVEPFGQVLAMQVQAQVVWGRPQGQ